jgi:hypothetical protein
MRFDIHLREGVSQALAALAGEMGAREATPRIDAAERLRLLDALQPIEHTTQCDDLLVGGVDGSGDYPAIIYGNSFVYITTAQATCYASDRASGLKEVAPTPEPILEFTCLPDDETRRIQVLDDAFAALAGVPVDEVIATSDYRMLKNNRSRRSHTSSALRVGLIRPEASDASNVGIQLRSTGQLGAALRLLRSGTAPRYLLLDGTMSLPFVQRRDASLFQEHLKRLCCVDARERGIGLFAVSKSHGLPFVEQLEELVREKFAVPPSRVAEHWYLRLPVHELDSWELSLTEGRRVPPVGAVTFLVRFHRTTTVLRVDMDVEFWRNFVRGTTEEETRANEQRIFQHLDYACHDQRCYGYPYPIKAGHDRAFLTTAERVVLRKQIVDAGVRAGMKRSLFREADQLTRSG